MLNKVVVNVSDGHDEEVLAHHRRPHMRGELLVREIQRGEMMESDVGNRKGTL